MSVSITLQTLTVIALVLACGVYSAWALMPAVLRRPLAAVLARLPLVGRLPAVVRAAKGPMGCGCDGCDRSTLVAKPGGGDTNVIRVLPRRPDA
jgi:hypothetical protein